MPSFKVQGRIVYIGETEQVSEVFSKRTFAIEAEDVSNSGMVFKNEIAFQLANNQTSILDNIRTGD